MKVHDCGQQMQTGRLMTLFHLSSIVGPLSKSLALSVFHANGYKYCIVLECIFICTT